MMDYPNKENTNLINGRLKFIHGAKKSFMPCRTLGTRLFVLLDGEEKLQGTITYLFCLLYSVSIETSSQRIS